MSWRKNRPFGFKNKSNHKNTNAIQNISFFKCQIFATILIFRKYKEKTLYDLPLFDCPSFQKSHFFLIFNSVILKNANLWSHLPEICSKWDGAVPSFEWGMTNHNHKVQTLLQSPNVFMTSNLNLSCWIGSPTWGITILYPIFKFCLMLNLCLNIRHTTEALF